MMSFLRNWLLPLEKLIEGLRRHPGIKPALEQDNPFNFQNMTTPKIQFILKYRDSYYANEDGSEYSLGPLQSGLWNSARFMSDMLTTQGVDSEIIQVIDNNQIDREVTRFKPDVVVIEAYWVVPEKFEILQKLHPTVKWVIRNHSKLPFLANEGIALEWTAKYSQYSNVYVSSNSVEANNDIETLIASLNPTWTDDQVAAKCPYLPNYYPINDFISNQGKDHDLEYIDIGCFGAIRPLKNHVLQAIAAIKFATDIGKTLRFHVNAVRVENRGEPVLKNLRAIFAGSQHQLVEHPWMNHADFLAFAATMDLGMQVSYTETFNIVAADLTSQNVPVVTSNEILWSSERLIADPNSSEDMVRALYVAYYRGRSDQIPYQNIRNINKSNDNAMSIWLDMVSEFSND